MRIVAGRLGGRNFASPRGHRTRPMSEKLRGALFNTLGDIEGLTVLDAFAGSGGLAYEAVSRGATHVTAIDNDKNAQVAIRQNIKALGLSQQIKLVSASASAWLSTTQATFDIVACDPPYDDIQSNLLQRLVARVKPGGLVVLSLPPKQTIDFSGDFTLLSSKNYGDATLKFYRAN